MLAKNLHRVLLAAAVILTTAWAPSASAQTFNIGFCSSQPNDYSCKAACNATVVVGNKGAAANTKLPCLNFLIQRPITKICEDPGCVGKCADITAAPGQCVHFKYPLNHDIKCVFTAA
ncbi:hypothetical protein BDZ90DRAFT_262160 [Jaminaea rosea]|uniref:Uncharacterized protein n=1 Tax=Jaminaea rosea TaxID=1569628 RepID=A0A316UJP9_9BASI|nr:hypothetical protein BDZ90DRAFT_262160 [Jaminaea rosea]PWN25512.1 hypothetical protein BDZ90DRAFT_262160 [Jaminaea rosea]